jgi:predicted nuclease with TOPRIM domain
LNSSVLGEVKKETDALNENLTKQISQYDLKSRVDSHEERIGEIEKKVSSLENKAANLENESKKPQEIVSSDFGKHWAEIENKVKDLIPNHDNTF